MVYIVIKFKYNFLFGAAVVGLFVLNSAAQATDWVLYEDESTDEALVINNGGAHDGEQHICKTKMVISVRPRIRWGPYMLDRKK
jgi:hypothetical protein